MQQLLVTLVADAMGKGASAIHIENHPSEDKLWVRLRRDGRMEPHTELPGRWRTGLMARIKSLAELRDFFRALAYADDIRTVVVQGRALRCGIGSGITADATEPGEWAEWRAKRAFVERVSRAFDLIETLALEDGRFRHLGLHLQRMQAAAAHFGYPWSEAALQLTLQQVQDTHPSGLWRVRLQLGRDGLYASQAVVCPPSPPQAYLQLAPEPLAEAHGEFVRFKTTRRAHYERWAPKDTRVDEFEAAIRADRKAGRRHPRAFDDADVVQNLFAYSFDSSSTDLRLLARGTSAPSAFSLAVTVGTSGAITGVTVDGQKNMFTVSGSRIIHTFR